MVRHPKRPLTGDAFLPFLLVSMTVTVVFLMPDLAGAGHFGRMYAVNLDDCQFRDIEVI